MQVDQVVYYVFCSRHVGSLERVDLQYGTPRCLVASSLCSILSLPGHRTFITIEISLTERYVLQFVVLPKNS